MSIRHVFHVTIASLVVLIRKDQETTSPFSSLLDSLQIKSSKLCFAYSAFSKKEIPVSALFLISALSLITALSRISALL